MKTNIYINGHFCYANKSVILTNGLDIVRHISFLDDDDFKTSHPDLVINKKLDSPDEDKSVGDSAFDSAKIYGSHINSFHFSITYHIIINIAITSFNTIHRKKINFLFRN